MSQQFDTAGKKISKLEDKAIRTIQLRSMLEKKQKQQAELRTVKCQLSNICVTEVPREEREIGKKIFKKRGRTF